MTVIAAANASSESKARANKTCSGTNDHATIQTELNKGGCVELTEGRYSIGQALHVVSGGHLVGAGMGATILERAAGNNGLVIDCQGASILSVRDLTIDDNPAWPAMPPGPEPTSVPMALRFYRCAHASASHVEVRHTWRLGIVVGRSNNVTIEDCLVRDARGLPTAQGGGGGHGIIVTSEAEPGRQVRITGCTLTGNWRTGIYATNVDGLVIDGNRCEDNCPKEAVDAGIERGGQIGLSYGARDVLVTHNVLVGGYWTQGVEVDVTENGQPTIEPSQHIVIANNLIRTQGFAGVTLYGDPNADAAHRACHIRVCNNDIRDCNQITTPNDGITYGAIHVFQTLTDFQIDGNTVTGDSYGSPGIKIGGSNNNYHLVNNRVGLVVRGGAVAVLLDKNGSVNKYVSANLTSVAPPVTT